MGTKKPSNNDVQKLDNLFASFKSNHSQKLILFYFRWNNEKPYENFSDYGLEMKKCWPEFENLIAIEKPFGFKFDINDQQAFIYLQVISKTQIEICCEFIC